MSAREEMKCPQHPDGEVRIDARAGDVICMVCAVVIGDRIVDVGTEWRSFNNEKSCKDPSRVGAPENPLLSSGDLSTSIAGGTFGNDDYGLRQLQRKAMSSHDRAITQAFACIKEMADRVHMPSSVIDQAKLVYKQALDSRMLRGKNYEAVSAAALYIACKKESVPRTFKEICALGRSSKRDIGRCYKLILAHTDQTRSTATVTGVDLVTRFVSNLQITAVESKRRVLAASLLIVERAAKLDSCAGRSPISIAAASIYLACDRLAIDKSAKDIGDVCGSAEVTVKQTYKLLAPHADDLMRRATAGNEQASTSNRS